MTAHAPVKFLLAFGLSVFVPPAVALAGELGIGDALPALVLQDQHGKPLSVGVDARIVLFAVDKSARIWSMATWKTVLRTIWRSMVPILSGISAECRRSSHA